MPFQQIVRQTLLVGVLRRLGLRGSLPARQERSGPNGAIYKNSACCADFFPRQKPGQRFPNRAVGGYSVTFACVNVSHPLPHFYIFFRLPREGRRIQRIWGGTWIKQALPVSRDFKADKVQKLPSRAK